MADKPFTSTAEELAQRRKGKQRLEYDPDLALSNPSSTHTTLPPPAQQPSYPVLMSPREIGSTNQQGNPDSYHDHLQTHPKRARIHLPSSTSNLPTDGPVDVQMKDLDDLTTDHRSEPQSNRPAPTILFLPLDDESTQAELAPPLPFEPLKKIYHTPEIVFFIMRYLRYEDVITLYAMSKDFRAIANSSFTGLIQMIARWKAPESAQIFSWVFFSPLCIRDPGFRPHPRVPNECRLVPSFRWLQFIYYREKIVQEIMSRMNDAGVRIPKVASKTVKKIWLLMDIPDNSRRIASIQSRWTDQDLLFAQMFFIKLDMRFCDPVTGKGQNKIRKMMMAQKTMTVLNDVLARRALQNEMDAIRMYVRWKWVPEPQHWQYPIFGIPPGEVGQLQYEGWGTGYPTKLVPIESLVIKEACKRNLGFQNNLIDMMQWGYVDPNTGDNIDRPRVPMRLWRLEDEYSSDEEGDDGLEPWLLFDHEPIGEERQEIIINQI
jgi:hypothetical protein